MKSAEEWTREYKYMLPDNYGITKELIEEIQLDAWKQGMTDAANIAILPVETCVKILDERDRRTSI